MSIWLVKSEPEVYSIDDLARDRVTAWEGVRNFQARNLLRTMKRGELVLFHHSNADPPGVAGVARVEREAYPDPTARDRRSEYYDPRATEEDGRWSAIDLKFLERFPRFVAMDDMKKEKELAKMELLRRGSRLSVQPVTREQFDRVRSMGKRR